MKQYIKHVYIALLAFCPLALAADPATVLQSAEPLMGALESIPDTDVYLDAAHVPGYGLQINGSYSGGFSAMEDEEVEQVEAAVRDILNGLATTVRGLDEGDWISLAVEMRTYPATHIVIRLKPRDPDTLEVWQNGTKR